MSVAVQANEYFGANPGQGIRIIGDIISDLMEIDTCDLITIYDRIRGDSAGITLGFAREYLRRLRVISADAKRITNKLPWNYLFVGLLRLALPAAAIIHCQRDPMDTCWSIFKKNFTDVQMFADDLKELGEYYLLYKRLMNFWNEVFPGQIHNVVYEELVENQDETRKLLRFCDLPWDERCLSFHNNARVPKTASRFQVTKPIYRDSIQFWRNYERHLQPLLKVFRDS